MTVSSISTSSSLQELLSLLGSIGSTGGSSSTLVASLLGGDADSLSISSLGQTKSDAQGSNPFKTDFDKLGSLIESGDLEAAKQAYAAMKERMQARPGQGGEDPMASDFSAIGEALESGDLEAAQEAWSTMQSKLEDFSAQHEEAASSSTKSTDLQALLVSMYSRQSELGSALMASNGTSGS